MLARRAVLWTIPAALLLHNAEEALFFPRYLPLVLGRLPDSWQVLGGVVTMGQVWAAMAILTLVAVALAAWANLVPTAAAPLWLLLLIVATLLLNVLWHVAAAVVLFDGYSPGLVTAVLVNLPLSVYLLRRSVRESWLTRGARWALLPAALLVHGPLLSGLLLLTERM
jgi:hypothetical protein